ncbi:MAG: 4Fe-4S binding protein [Dehalococcoidia bacterium]|nr:4Fe-4S binding protein [Dehalococcoidia bacterium]
MSQTTLAPEPVARRRIDLLAFGPLDRLSRSSFFPLVLQVAVLLLFAAALYDGFFGTDVSSENLLTWGAFTIFFWPVILATLVLLGRAWCAVCPIGTIAAIANRFTLGLRWPRLLSNLSLSLIAFVLVLWMIRPVTEFDTVPSQTAWFFLTVATAAAATGLLFSGRVFCRHVCPISAHLAVISLVAPVSLESAPTSGLRSGPSLDVPRAQAVEACRGCTGHPCTRGTAEREGCAWGLYPAVMGAMNRYCSLCLKCVKNCPAPGTIKAVVSWPFSRLWKVSQPRPGEAFSILILMAIFLFHMAWGHGTRMPTFVHDAAPNVLPFLSAEDAMYVSVEVIGLVTMIGLYSALAVLSSKMLHARFRAVFPLFAFAYLPLVVFRALGYLTQDVLRSGGRWVTFALNQMGVSIYLDPELFGSFSDPIFEGTTYNVYAALLTVPILLGLLVAAYAAYRIARSLVADNGTACRLAAPHIALMLVIVLALYEFPYLVGYKIIGAPGLLYG